MLPFETSLTLGKISWAEFKAKNNLSEGSYLELLDNRIQSIIQTHGGAGGRSKCKPQ